MKATREQKNINFREEFGSYLKELSVELKKMPAGEIAKIRQLLKDDIIEVEKVKNKFRAELGIIIFSVVILINSLLHYNFLFSTICLLVSIIFIKKIDDTLNTLKATRISILMLKEEIHLYEN